MVGISRRISLALVLLVPGLLAASAAAQDPARDRRVARGAEAVADTTVVKERGDTVLLPILGLAALSALPIVLKAVRGKKGL